MNQSNNQHLNPEIAGSQQQLKAILDTAIAGILRLRFYPDGSTQHEYISPHCAAIFGYTVAELMPDATLWQQGVHPEDWRDVVSPTLARILAQRGTSTEQMEYRFRRPDGRWVWVLAQCWVQWQPDLGYWDVTVVDTDISDRKALEAAQKVSEAKLNSILNNVNAIITHLWLEPHCVWTIDYVTGRSEALCGYTTAELMADQSLWIGLIVPEDWQAIEAKIFANIQAEQSGTYEYRLYHRNGSLRWISQANHSQWDPERKAWSVSIVSTDISQQKQAELERQKSNQFLQLITDSIPGCIAYVDASQRYRFVNRTYERWFHRRKEEIVGQSLRTVIGETAYAQVQQNVERVLAGEQVSYEAELFYGDDHHRFVAGILVPDYSATGVVEGYYALLTDISDRKRAEQELIAAKNAAEAAACAKSDFLATMSHEIRTPMNGVLGMLSLLKNDPLTSQQQLHLNIAQSSAESLLTLLNDILDFSKVDAGKLTLKPIDFELHTTLESIIQTMALSAQAKGLEIVLHCQPLEPMQVYGDRDRLRQIFTNLINNAIKFTDQGAIVVQCHVTSDGSRLLLTTQVRDTGMGIPAEAIASLFDPFTQVDPSTTRQHSGTGLGLSICQRLCDLMGGSIQVQSTLGRGSCFEFTVPLARSAQPAQPRPALDLSGITVLVVDDNVDSRNLLQFYLEQWGATVLTATNEPDAIAHCHRDQSPIQYAFLDLKMPSIDGITLGQRLKDDPHGQGITLILMTDIIENCNTTLIHDLGLQACLSKPVLLSELQDLLLNHHPGCLSTPAPVTPPVPAPATWPPDIRLLLVEDSVVNQLVFRGFLKTYGLEVDVVSNGKIALEHLQSTVEHPYTVIFMDCQMPMMDGYEASRQIRLGQGGDLYQNVPIIALTANALAGDRDKCLDAGMNDYLSKPINPSQLLEILHQWLPSAPTRPKRSRELFDADHLADLLDGDRVVITQVYEVFLRETRIDLEELERAIARRDLTYAQCKAHGLKGAAANIGCTALSQTAYNVEAAIKAEDIILAREHWLTLKQVFGAAEITIQQWLQQST
ncbi:response regulator [Spirulina major]|uniref:response regulator n=1 Tax=Spirulina major TaxID=270636 RepID=UPI00093364D7|nr:response regulator [Spirulina major]